MFFWFLLGEPRELGEEGGQFVFALCNFREFNGFAL
jgi:hypothetical protein